MRKIIIATMMATAISATSVYGQLVDFYSAQTDGGSGGTGSVTLNNAIGTGTNTWVFGAYGREGGASTAAGHDVTAFTFGGVAL